MGHHTTTTKSRPKRPDARPNGKKRRKEKQVVAARTQVQDMRATSTPKSQRKERKVTGILRPVVTEQTIVAKRVRFLQNLLKQIEALKERKETGEKLDHAQLLKVGRLDTVVAEIEEILGVNLDSTDEEDGGEEEKEDQEKYSIPSHSGRSGR